MKQLFKKVMLRVGRRVSPDGEVNITPKRLRHWAESFKKMAAAGLKIPMGWDHSDDLAQMIPLKMAANGRPKQRSAANAVGFLHRFNLTKDGQAAVLTMDIRDAKAIEKAENNTAEISPVILDEWIDGDGRKWNDVVTHMDLVYRPVDHRQTPFAKVPDTKAIAASALRMSTSGGKPVPYRMADDEDYEEKDEADDSSSDDEEVMDDEMNNDMPAGTNAGENPEKLKMVCAWLGEFGIALPSDTDEGNFLDRLHTALMTAAKTREEIEAENNGGNDDTTGSQEDDMPPETLTESSPAFAAMSAESKAAYQFAQNQYRLSLQGRLEKLRDTGRCTPAEFKERSKDSGAVRLSLNKQTQQPNKTNLERWMESREALPQGAAMDLTQRLRMAGSQVSEVPIDRELTGEEPEGEELDEMVDTFFKKKPERHFSDAPL